jgi:transposase
VDRGAPPRDQKKAAGEGRTLIWVDEAGFYLAPGPVRTYAPRGQTPILTVPLTRDHLSVCGALTADGRLLQQVQDRAFCGADSVAFLRHLLAHVPGKLLVVWDGAPIHRGRAVKEFLASQAGQRIWLERLPAYAPDRNPVEGIWHYLKHRELGNVCCYDQGELRYELRGAMARLRHKHAVLQGCLDQCA